MRILCKFALANLTVFAAQAVLPAATTAEETHRAGTTAALQVAAAQVRAASAQPAPAEAASSQLQPTEHTQTLFPRDLLNRDYRSAIIPYQRTQELRARSRVFLDLSPFRLRVPPSQFEVEVAQDEPLEDVLNRIIPELRDYTRRQEPLVIIVKRNSIQRLRIGSISKGTIITAEKTEGVHISPGDILVLEPMGY